MELLPHFRIYPVTNVSHGVNHLTKPAELASAICRCPEPVSGIEGQEYVVEEVVAHRRLERGYQFLNLMAGEPRDGVTRLQARNVLHTDGTPTEMVSQRSRRP